MTRLLLDSQMTRISSIYFNLAFLYFLSFDFTIQNFYDHDYDYDLYFGARILQLVSAHAQPKISVNFAGYRLNNLLD